MVHELKVYPSYFIDLLTGVKQFEFRKDDRGFSKGDLLCLFEFDPNVKRYSGRFVLADVIHVYCLAPFDEAFAEWVVMSIAIHK